MCSQSALALALRRFAENDGLFLSFFYLLSHALLVQLAWGGSCASWNSYGLDQRNYADSQFDLILAKYPPSRKDKTSWKCKDLLPRGSCCETAR